MTQLTAAADYQHLSHQRQITKQNRKKVLKIHGNWFEIQLTGKTDNEIQIKKQGWG